MDAAINKLNGEWKITDFFGAVRTRLGIRRNRYRMQPDLYSIGKPDSNSPVFVTANYKLSVDHLRRAAKSLNAWILVLDTKGVNVWCAAGKGTFGTEELINRITKTNLSGIVKHKRLILPQLGAPGVVPLEVKRQTDFNVNYGPVEAGDLPVYIENGYRATEEMRKKKFPLMERLAVSLTHFSQGLIPAMGIALLFLILDLIFMKKSGPDLRTSLFINSAISLTAMFFGTLLAGALLPVLPGRAFSLKGLSVGFLFSILSFSYLFRFFPTHSLIYSSGKILLLLVWIVFQVLNLTGSSTYTSLSGVQKEMAVSIPLLVAGTITGLAMIITGGILL